MFQKEELKEKRNFSGQSYAKEYLTIYILYQLTMAITSISFYNISEAFCILFLFNLCYLIYIIARRPYLATIHNLGIILNHSATLLFTLLLIIDNYISVSEVVCLIFLYIIITFQFMILIVGVWRLAHEKS